jgi:hypothetical protein
MSVKLKPGTELHLHLLSVMNLITEIELEKEQGFKKAIRSFEAFVCKHSDNAEFLNSKNYALAVHNWNVIHNNIELDILATPIGELTIEK